MGRARHWLVAGLVVTVAASALLVRDWWPEPAAGTASGVAASPAAVSVASPAPSPPAASHPPVSPAPTTERPLTGTATVATLTSNLADLFGAGNSFSVAGLDLTTGHSIRAGATAGMSEASIVKLDILQAWLYQEQQDGEGLDSGEMADAAAMMEQSDNAAGDRIFVDESGNSGLGSYNRVLGLTHTALDPNGTWGLSTTSAADQLSLLKALVSAHSPLTAASRNYALTLMSQVEADQTWGISAAADRGAPSQLKNGWLNIDSDGGLWAVNSDGLTTVRGHKLLLVVLSQHQPDFQTGVNRVQAAAVALAAALN